MATGQVGELFGRVRDIQRKAADTELLVQEICRWVDVVFCNRRSMVGDRGLNRGWRCLGVGSGSEQSKTSRPCQAQS